MADRPLAGELQVVLDLLLDHAGPAPLKPVGRKLKLLGRGDLARVYEYPSDPDLVVRIGQGDDGWIAYALGISEDGVIGAHPTAARSPHAPRVVDLAFVPHAEFDPMCSWDAHRWVAVTEKLSPMPRAQDATWRAVRQLVHPERLITSSAEMKHLTQTYPDLPAFIADWSGLLRDVDKGSNFMMRGDTLVVNDPIGCMRAPQMESAIEMYSLEARLGASVRAEPAMAPGM